MVESWWDVPVRGAVLALGVLVGAWLGFLVVRGEGVWTVDSVPASALRWTLMVGLATEVPLAFVRCGPPATVAVAVLLGALAWGNLAVYAGDESSTAALGFLGWWSIGPVLGATAAVLSRR